MVSWISEISFKMFVLADDGRDTWCMYVSIGVLPARISVYLVPAVPAEARRGHWMLQNWNYRWLCDSVGTGS